jgi:Ulp1 family protease
MKGSTTSSRRSTRTSSKNNKQTSSITTDNNKPPTTTSSNNNKTINNNTTSQRNTTVNKNIPNKETALLTNIIRSPVRTRSSNAIQTTVKNLFQSPSIYTNTKKSIQNNINNVSSTIQTINSGITDSKQVKTSGNSSPIAKALQWTQNKFTTPLIESEDESQSSTEKIYKSEEEIKFKTPTKAPPLLQDLELASSTSPSTLKPTSSQYINRNGETKDNNKTTTKLRSQNDNKITINKYNQQTSPDNTATTVTSPPHKKPNNNESPINTTTIPNNTAIASKPTILNNNITKASHIFAEALNKAHSEYNSPTGITAEIPSLKQKITDEELNSIKDGQYITDTIINFWSEWLSNNYVSAKNCHFCSSLFFTKLLEEGYGSVKKWDKNITMDEKDIIFIPINNIKRFHWYLAVIIPGKFITILDSFLNSQTKKESKQMCDAIYGWMNGKGIEANEKNLPLQTLQNTPQQVNGYDCGIYVCKFMQCILAQLQNDGPLTHINKKYFNIIPSDITALRLCIEEKLVYSKSKQNKSLIPHAAPTKRDSKEDSREDNNHHTTKMIETTSNNQRKREGSIENKDRVQDQGQEERTGTHRESEERLLGPLESTIESEEESDSSEQSGTTMSTRISTNLITNNNDEAPTEEDDINTTASGETTTFRRSEMDIEQPPDSFRYRLILPMPKTPAEAVARQQNGENLAPHETDPFLRLRELLVKFYTHIRASDETLFLMKWSSKVIERVALPELLPTDPVQLSEYFEGYNPKTEEGKRQFFRVRISSAINKKSIIASGKAFTAPHGGSFNILSVNVEESTEIGYLIYSSRYTDTDHLSKFLEKKTKFPWGFAYKQLYASDPEADWRKRVRVQTIQVPAEKKEIAIATVQDIFKITSMTQPEFPMFTQKYLYAAAEHEHDQFPDEASIQNQKVMMDRHRIHFNALEAKFTTSISGSIDRMINTRTGKKASMRQLILSIKSTREGPLKGTPLFHAVDFISDSKEVTFQKNKKGPGGPGHIFSYYETHRSEAVAMVRGLGVYIGKIFGKKATYRYFNADHWKVNDGWRWSVSQKKFITREANQIQQNVQYDYNAAVLLLENDAAEEHTEDEDNPSTAERFNPTPSNIRDRQEELNYTDRNTRRYTSTNPILKAAHNQTNRHAHQIEIKQEPTILNTVEETQSEDEESDISTVLDIQQQLQADLIHAQIDPDSQSIGNDDDKENPKAIHISDQDSTTSSLTWNRSIKSTEDDNSTIASHSIMSVSTASAATIPSHDTSLKSITNTQNMEDMYDPSLSESENIKNYENYIQANTRKAQDVARRNYTKICKAKAAKSELTTSAHSIQNVALTTISQNDEKSEKSTTSSVELEDLLSTPLETNEQEKEEPTGGIKAGNQS